MTQLLIQGAAILAQGPFEMDAESIKAPDAIYPKHVIPGWGMVDVDLPEDFTVSGYEWNGGLVKKPPVVDAAAHNAAIDAQIMALEARITQRRLREAVLSGDNSFIADIDAQIAALRVQRL